MDFETFLDSLFAFIKNGDNAYFVIYALLTCVLTQAFKKLFVNKVKVDILHKFDFAVLLPFVFGAVFSVVNEFCVKGVKVFDFTLIVNLAVNCAAIGALAAAMFRFVSSLSGKSLNKLLSDDVFAVFYSQLLYFGEARSMLVNKKLSLQDFLAQVKLVSSNALSIYQSDESEDVKRQKLARLLSGIVDENSVNACVNSLNKALINYVSTQSAETKKSE